MTLLLLTFLLVTLSVVVLTGVVEEEKEEVLLEIGGRLLLELIECAFLAELTSFFDVCCLLLRYDFPLCA